MIFYIKSTKKKSGKDSVGMSKADEMFEELGYENQRKGNGGLQ